MEIFLITIGAIFTLGLIALLIICWHYGKSRKRMPWEDLTEDD